VARQQRSDRIAGYVDELGRPGHGLFLGCDGLAG
jgi:hypothetical protein